MNTQWFSDRIAESRYGSLRKLAKAIDMSAAALSLTLRGKRKLQLKEAERLAHALSVPLPDVLKHAGLDVSTPSRPNPLPNVPRDVKRLLARESKDSPLWGIIRLYCRR